ncbi:hypothetical protein N0V90_006346 [Kalmusia sp. IMI 367209]|nr:hypothetical protein N0V90_006346 [Kalmusia sp. IMI 367209]
MSEVTAKTLQRVFQAVEHHSGFINYRYRPYHTVPSAPSGADDRSARCWELAVKVGTHAVHQHTFIPATDIMKIFNTTLTNDPEKIIYTYAPSPGYNTATYSDIVDSAKQCIQHSVAVEKSALRKAMEVTVSTFNQYAQVIDVLIQHQPYVTALVWGAVRGLLQVAGQEITVSSVIPQAINKITGEMGRWDQYLRLFPDSDRLQSVVAQLFAQIINYVVRANKYYSASLPKRYVKAGMSTTPVKLRDAWTEIEDLSIKLEREANLASEIRIKASRDEHAKHDGALLGEILEQERYRNDSLMSIKAIVTAQDLVGDKMKDMKIAFDAQIENDAIRRRENRLESDRNRIVTWLQRFRSQKQVVRTWEPGTAEWVLYHPVYLDWEERNNDGLMWINGMPGCGKSIMASFLTHKSPSLVKISHFLQAAVEENSTKTVSMAASILVQFIGHPTIASDQDLTASLIKHALPLLESFSTYENCSFEQIWEVLENVYADLPPFTLVVDALDESYAAEDALKLVDKLKIMSLLPQSRVIVLSRIHHFLQESLKDCATIQMDETTITHDITHFIQKEVERTPKIRIPAELILSKATNYAKGMFLWVKLMLQYLQQASTPRMQRARLEKFPVGLTTIYEKLLSETGAKLEPEQVKLRKRIFMLLVAAKTPLTVDDISVALALDRSDQHPDKDDLLIDPSGEINALCWPFTKAIDTHIQFVHYSMQEFLLLEEKSIRTAHIHFTLRESNEYMALKCLFRLINAEARSIKILEPLLRLRLGDSALPTNLESLPRRWPFYPYAANYWHIHLILSENTLNILRYCEMFLGGLHFITWVEEFDDGVRDMGAIVDVQASLSAWHMGLSMKQRECIDISRFFEKPFNNFFDLKSVRRDTPEVAYMALQRLGLYHNFTGTQSGGRTLKDLQQLVAEGFSSTLGASHPLTLRCITNWCIERIVDDDRELVAGETLLLDTMNLQKEILGDGVYDNYHTQQYAGLAMYYRGKFDGAIEHLRASYEGLGRILGPNHEYFQHSRLYYAHVLTATSQFDVAYRIYEEVWGLWSHLHGTQHPLSTMTQCNLGVIYRKLHKFDLAERHLVDCLRERQRMHGCSVATFDSLIQIALLYRDMGRVEEAHAYLDLAEGMDLTLHGFERYCHVYHLRAVLVWKSGDQKTARKQLEALLSKGGQHPTSRALMWVRLTLADLLRQHGHEKNVSSIFVNIVERLHKSPKKLSKSALEAQLQDAENSLRVARDRGAQVAEDELRSKGLVWLEPEAFWIIFGGPAAEIS